MATKGKLLCICLPWVFFTPGITALGEERITRELRIYWDMPAEGDADERSETELYYEPYYFSPAAKAQDISVDVFYDAEQLGGNGTCVEMGARFQGANEFVQIGFVATNARRLGEREGLNIAERLGVARGQKVYLELKARRRANDHANVSFRVGGLSGNPHKDSLRFPATRKPDLDELTADWTAYRIDLTEQVHRLNAVLCPLVVTIEINKNPKAKREKDPVTGREERFVSVVFYVDEVRFICVSDE
jgi:hypothetical protein